MSISTRIALPLAIILCGFVEANTAKPTSKFTVACVERQCTFDASTSVAAVAFSFDFGTGQKPELLPVVKNTFRAGTYCVKLTVHDAFGASSYSTKLITVPSTSTAFKACPANWKPAAPPPAIVHDTVFRTDTLRIVRVDTLPIVHDTLTLPGRVDTLRIITLVPAPPTTTGRTVIVTRNNEYLVYQGATLIGQLWPVDLNAGTWRAYSVVTGTAIMPCVGIASGCTVFASQDAARDALP